MNDSPEGAGADTTLASADDARPQYQYSPPRPDPLQHVGAQTLMEAILPEPTWLVEGLLSTSCLALLASAPKMGKSLLTLMLALAVSLGKSFLGMETKRSPVLYLALEDKFQRLQTRLWAMADEASDDLRLVTGAATLGAGLIDQLEQHLNEWPDTKLVIIDTLQLVRDPGEDYSYAGDYYDMARLKDFAEERDVCVLVVHHLRKMFLESDEFQNVSGTSGLTGAVDLMAVMSADKRGSDTRKLTVTGRDVSDAQYVLRRDGLRFEVVERLGQEELAAQAVPECVRSIAAHIDEIGEPWTGTASELVALLGLDVAPNALGKFLAQHRLWMAEQGVEYKHKRTREARLISLTPANGGGAETKNEIASKEDSDERGI